MKLKYRKYFLSQLNIVGGTAASSKQPAAAYDSQLYCRCKGMQKSDIYIKCDGDDECPNGGWMHPKCTADLANKSKEDLDELEEWYCEDCVERIRREEEGDIDMEEEKEEEDKVEEFDTHEKGTHEIKS